MDVITCNIPSPTWSRTCSKSLQTFLMKKGTRYKADIRGYEYLASRLGKSRNGVIFLKVLMLNSLSLEGVMILCSVSQYGEFEDFVKRSGLLILRVAYLLTTPTCYNKKGKKRLQGRMPMDDLLHHVPKVDFMGESDSWNWISNKPKANHGEININTGSLELILLLMQASTVVKIKDKEKGKLLCSVETQRRQRIKFYKKKLSLRNLEKSFNKDSKRLIAEKGDEAKDDLTRQRSLEREESRWQRKAMKTPSIATYKIISRRKRSISMLGKMEQIYWVSQELRYCAQCLIIENEDFVKEIAELRYCAQCLIIENEDFVKEIAMTLLDDLQKRGKDSDLQLLFYVVQFHEILNQREALNIVTFMETVL
ncbi:hypothetical protein Tco_1228828 [Tanacetum coccineum]